MTSRTPVPGLPEPEFRPLTELEDDAYGSGNPMGEVPKPPHILTNKAIFAELLQQHFGAKKVHLDIEW